VDGGEVRSEEPPRPAGTPPKEGNMSAAKGYKSSGGKMIWNEELQKEIPQGWEVVEFSHFIDTINGFAFKSDEFSDKGEVSIVKIKNVIPPIVDLSDVQFFNGKLVDSLNRVRLVKGDILITMTGSGVNQINSAVGQVGKYYGQGEALINQRVCKLKLKNTSLKEYVYQFISSMETHNELLNGSTGSANQANISPDQIKSLRVIQPTQIVVRKFQDCCQIIDSFKRIESQKYLKDLKNLILSKMTQVEVAEKLVL
jgi:type I restriction enzyme S subunit